MRDRKVSTFAFGGGLDTNSAALAIPPGALAAGENYEPLAEGYGRVAGYERYDGQEAPSEVVWYALPFTLGSLEISAGDDVNGASSGATAVVAGIHGLTGDWTLGTAEGTLVLIAITGAFVADETIRIGTDGAALSSEESTLRGADNDTDRAARFLIAMAHQRTRIDPVPGSGPVRGVAVHDGTVYAWRDNAGATAMICHKATAAGWVALETLTRLPFNTGTAEIAEGATVTGGTSAATGVVVSVEIASGTWDGSNAAGFIILKTVTGTWGAAEAIQVGGVTKATAAGATVAQTLGPGGRVRWLSHNFYGASNRYRLYGCTGESKAFELIPGAGMVLIVTGMTDDRPTRIFEINNHLGLCFRGGSIQFSGTLRPLQWAVITGAGEIGFGTEINDVVQANETAVAFFGEAKIAILQGRDSSDFILDTLTEEAGAEPDSAQRVTRTLYLDRRGLRTLEATQAFGNFKAGTQSGRIERFFLHKAKAGLTLIGTYVCRSKSHYRMVWSDGSGLSVYMGGKYPEAIPFRLAHVPTCFGAGELDLEGIFFGDADGYVHRAESGNSQDGEAIAHYAMTGFNHFGSPAQQDRFFKVEVELDAPTVANLSVAVQYDYGDASQPISPTADFTVPGGGGLWDIADWNTFNWSSPLEVRAGVYIDGIGRNAGFIFAGTADLDQEPHILSAYTVHHAPRKVQR